MLPKDLSPENFNHRRQVYMRWSDMDELAHINNAKYLTYMEEARGYCLDAVCKYDWKKNPLILAHVSVDYLAPLFFHNEAFIYTRTSRLGTKSFEIEYLLLDETNGQKRPVLYALSTLVGYDYKSGKTAPINEDVRKKLAEFDPGCLGK